jgi:Ca-activated chloride channel family protein
MTRAISWSIGFLAVAATLHSAHGQQAFRAATTVVRVDVSVTERGKAVTGLTAADFEVRDNGVRQATDFLRAEKMPLSLALAIDESGSVAGDRLAHLRGATEQAIGALRPGDRAGLITFSHVVALRARPTTDHAGVRFALDRPEASGGTALVDATYAGLLLPGDEPDFRSILIVFSDGVETISWLTPGAVLEAAKGGDVVAYAVTVGGRPRLPFLRDLANATGGAILEVETTNDLAQAFVSVLDEFRQRYLLSYRPRGVASDGWHRLDVRVNRRGVTVKARPGYMAR